MSYLEAAEDNMNGNIKNVKLVQALIDRGHEVAKNLEKEYGEMWENPLKWSYDKNKYSKWEN